MLRQLSNKCLVLRYALLVTIISNQADGRKMHTHAVLKKKMFELEMHVNKICLTSVTLLPEIPR